MSRLSKEEIVRQLDELSDGIRARMAQCDPMMIGLLPTACDWATREEIRSRLLLPYGLSFSS